MRFEGAAWLSSPVLPMPWLSGEDNQGEKGRSWLLRTTANRVVVVHSRSSQNKKNRLSLASQSYRSRKLLYLAHSIRDTAIMSQDQPFTSASGHTASSSTSSASTSAFPPSTPASIFAPIRGPPLPANVVRLPATSQLEACSDNYP